jgi:hypothetical protein
MRKLKLLPRLVPKPLWGRSARKLFGWTPPWKTIRSEALHRAHDRCSICGDTTGPLHCDEEWDYSDQAGTATLVGFRAICESCHDVVHIARSTAHGKGREARRHMSRVNGLTSSDTEKIISKSMEAWRGRSQKEWRVVVHPDLLRRYPQLAKLQV